MRRARLFTALASALIACAEAAPTAAPDATITDASASLDATSLADSGPSPDAAVIIDAGHAPDASTPDAAEPDAGTSSAPDPVLFVHGIGGSSTEFDVMRGRLVADGWPSDRLFAIDFADPRWGCNVDNAATLQAEAMRIRALTGAARIDLVAHSMGTLSSRHYVKELGGTGEVNTYVTLGGLHHGNRLSCLNPLDVCVWQELCPTREFLQNLNAEPATPGALAWVSIYSTDDGTVPVESSHLDGAENIQVSGVPHAGAGGLLEDEGVYAEVKRVLEYPAW